MRNTSFRERVHIAALAGFSAISLFPVDYRHALDHEGLSEHDMAYLLEDNGLCLAELDPLLDWIPELRAAGTADTAFGGCEQDFYQMADALGGRALNVVMASDTDLAVEAIVTAFAAVCDRAAERDLLVHLEFLPWSRIGNLETALNVVNLANRRNGGIMLDTWHHFRSGSSNAVIDAAASEKIFAVQISDAPRQPGANIIVETLEQRLLPGEGDIELGDILSRLNRVANTAPIGVEVFSKELATRPAAEVAVRAHHSVRQLLGNERTYSENA